MWNKNASMQKAGNMEHGKNGIINTDVLIIGAGLLGCFTARNLKRYDIDVTVLEMEDGYHLLYFSEALTGDSPTVAAARSALIDAWSREQMENARAALLNQWVKEAKIVLFEGV